MLPIGYGPPTHGLPLFSEPKPDPALHLKDQTRRVLRHMQAHGSLSVHEAQEHLGCYRLAARIAELKAAGYTILTRLEKHANGSHARYFLREGK